MRRKYKCILVVVGFLIIGSIAIYFTVIQKRNSIFTLNNTPANIKDLEVWGKHVENGTAYDFATIPWTPNKTLRVPKGTGIVVIPDATQLTVYIEKYMTFYGHPVEPMSIRERKNHMGIAIKSEEKTLSIAEYGGFTTFEGGAGARFVIYVPKNVTVEQHEKLDAEGRHEDPIEEREWKDPQDHEKGWLRKGWHIVPDQPDNACTARNQLTRTKQ